MSAPPQGSVTQPKNAWHDDGVVDPSIPLVHPPADEDYADFFKAEEEGEKRPVPERRMRVAALSDVANSWLDLTREFKTTERP